MERQLEWRDIDKIIPYARNSRTHSDEQVAQIAASIKEFGWTNPLLIDDENGIIAGHGRLAAARKLGHTKVPVIQLSGLTETQKRAYVIADNKLALNAGWDEEMLKLELQELQVADFELELLGFTDSEMKELGLGVDEVDLPDLNNGDREPFQQMTFTLHDEQVEQIERAIKKAKTLGPFDESLNQNSNGNGLARVCEIFLTQNGDFDA